MTMLNNNKVCRCQSALIVDGFGLLYEWGAAYRGRLTKLWFGSVQYN